MKVRDLIEKLNEYPDWYEVQILFKFHSADSCELSDFGFWFGDDHISDEPGEPEKCGTTIFITN
jgi:hypothetical protein